MGVPAEAIERAHDADLLELVAQYGVRLKRVTANELAGPCPACGRGTDRFSVNTRKQIWNCRQCSLGGDAIALVRHVENCSFAEAVARLTGASWTPSRAPGHIPTVVRAEVVSVTTAQQEAARLKGAIAQAAEIVSGLTPLAASPLALAYLEQTRKIDVAEIRDVLERTDAIGWHPSVYFNEPDHPLHGQRLGAIIGIMTDAVTAAPTGAISRTYLAPDGTKIGKAKTLSSPRGLIRLTADEDVLAGLHIAEGLETALTGMAFGFRPMWATGDSGLMAAFPILAGVEALGVFVDHDVNNGAGEKAAREVEARWLGAGREAKLFRSDAPGDLNDALKGSVA